MGRKGMKRIMITLPYQLLKEVDGVVALEKVDRSQLIQEATRQYLSERKKRQLIDHMRKGYIDMAKLNLDLAEEAYTAEGQAYDRYTDYLLGM